ncbi:hypothetical protein CALCODRAFT_345777 [Calocera cornea HHB12733]|uniref:Uncharacterized protein n=1 Tax=Calocera cornea HHB12733 TaxID=1353952 RepID=A0A165EV75_9BASI|nr:hypothetical protein CALCODRAFT_345777 [Calocera cornea HHB12733]
MNGAYTPNGFGSKPFASLNAQDRSSSAPPPAFSSPARGRGRHRRGNGSVAHTPPPMESDDGMSDRETDKDAAMKKELEARRRRQEELRVRMAEYQAKRREEMEGRERQEAEELQRRIAAEEADPVLRRMRADAVEESKRWESRLLAMPANQAWIEVKDTQDERVAQWQELKLMGSTEYRPTRGLCEGMCSASEVVERVATMDVMAPERDPTTGQPDPSRFVKRYKRVEPVIIPTDVRTSAALVVCRLDWPLRR